MPTRQISRGTICYTEYIIEPIGIEQALMSTIHSATAKAVGEVIPELKGRMTGMSLRVPTANVSVVDLTARLRTTASYRDVCVAMENAAQHSMKGIITCTSGPVVSSDIIGFQQTGIFDETAGIMLDDNLVKCIAWYDNEWGYTNKLIDLITHMHSVNHPRRHLRRRAMGQYYIRYCPIPMQ